jgi:DNA-directed RNA polymerase specialized sigma24 family protein
MAQGFQREWPLSQSAFSQLLKWLDEGIDSTGKKYLEIRRRLVQYFDRKNCLSPDDLADETLNRVARRLAEEGAITGDSPARYCYIMAKFVLLEHYRKPKPVEIDLESVGNSQSPAGAQSDTVRDEHVDRLGRCLESLTPDNRELILDYYQGDQRSKIENRRQLASKLGLTMNALSIRACRIRGALEDCVKKHSAGKSA